MEVLRKELIVVGAGPAGLSAAIEAAKCGVKATVFDENAAPGGQLFKQIHKFFGSKEHKAKIRGFRIGEDLLKEAEEKGVEVVLNATVIGLYKEKEVQVQIGTEVHHYKGDAILVATGAAENMVNFRGWTLPGVIGAGAAQTMMNLYHVKPGNRILMLGSGNVGLVVSYQLMQAGCDVKALVEAAPKIGGYAVHAAKIRRAGVPILLRHTIIEAKTGQDGSVCGCVTAKVDEHFAPIPGTEETIDCDVITIAAGLKPTMDLIKLAGCELTYDALFGGYVPLHSEKMETSVRGIFVAGDSTGVEEANTALDEGRIAGISAAEGLGLISETEATDRRTEIWRRLDSLRMGPFGERRRTEKNHLIELYHESVKEQKAFA